MQSRLNLGLFAFCCLPAFAQLDSSALRAKLGQPLHQETFRMPAGFDVVVAYGISTQVCKLEVPAMMPRDPAAKISSGTERKQRMYDFLADLVASSARGKEGLSFTQAQGTISVMTTQYENVTVSEVQNGSQPEGGTITIRFKNVGCETH